MVIYNICLVFKVAHKISIIYHTTLYIFNGFNFICIVVWSKQASGFYIFDVKHIKYHNSNNDMVLNKYLIKMKNIFNFE